MYERRARTRLPDHRRPEWRGKATFALKYLPEAAPGTAFVNADLIAAGLSPLAPEQQLIAAHLFFQQIKASHR